MRTRPQTTDLYWYDLGTLIETLKLERLLDVYAINRIAIDFFNFNSIFRLPPGNPLEATLHNTEETCILGYCRPPGHKRKPQSESWKVGIMVISPLWPQADPSHIDRLIDCAQLCGLQSFTLQMLAQYSELFGYLIPTLCVSWHTRSSPPRAAATSHTDVPTADWLQFAWARELYTIRHATDGPWVFLRRFCTIGTPQHKVLSTAVLNSTHKPKGEANAYPGRKDDTGRGGSAKRAPPTRTIIALDRHTQYPETVSLSAILHPTYTPLGHALGVNHQGLSFELLRILCSSPELATSMRRGKEGRRKRVEEDMSK
ncbi:uncharacterized protein LACBIDRAFT_335257 [Laccaria bicolor S238N-H82]|uniref:Predicted protein n=1 Tax=Laccaria bicolor (strain S238N-H82 / ATCC MYA-4686) TaxID=486041 RepID=B0E1U3_LACBS|nr:uncharacterized protein LACBIDRAFT_335257 [Laccaria bicolor S238N-H82]EDQ99199.1 predicted protein [Laccaria bicolor S238N-H82]|eukprot:XP_001890166.1 predicted protein [Laccaria bicolor S238N-H82]